METVSHYDPQQEFSDWEALIKVGVRSSPVASAMPGPVARAYFSPGGIANPENLPTSEAVEHWASENGISSAYDKGTDEYIFYISPSRTVAKAFEEGFKAMATILKEGNL